MCKITEVKTIATFRSWGLSYGYLWVADLILSVYYTHKKLLLDYYFILKIQIFETIQNERQLPFKEFLG